MDWQLIPWWTITDDFDVDQWHGTNAFYRDDDDHIYRTYFINERGDEALGRTWSYLDMTALGRQEEWEDSPEGYRRLHRTGSRTTTTPTGTRRDRPHRGAAAGGGAGRS